MEEEKELRHGAAAAAAAHDDTAESIDMSCPPRHAPGTAITQASGSAAPTVLDDKAAAATTRQATGSTSTTTTTTHSTAPQDESSVCYAYEHFHRGRQLRRLLLKSLSRWLITVALCVSIYGVLLAYSRGALLQRKKKEFNSLVIALTICLGLNIASSLKANAMDLQWWLLSLRRYRAREADLIMSSENFTTMLQLGWTTRHTFIQIFVTVFVTMNIASQVALALLGITYNINPADKFTITKPGLVSIPDLSDIQGKKVLSAGTRANASEDINSRRYSANSFGQIGSGLGENDTSMMPAPGTLYNPDLPQVFYSGGDGTPDYEGATGNFSYTYVFYESNVDNASYVGSVATNRSVTVTAVCGGYKVVSGGNGLSANITVRLDDGDAPGYLPVANGGSQILYLHDPAEDAHDTWSQVSAFEPSDTDPWFYVCNVTVGNVTNAVAREHLMDAANFTRYVPPAIALQGYGSSVVGLTNDTTNYQFQSYPAQSYFGAPTNGSSVALAVMVSRYAINAVAACALANTNVDARGMAPQRAIVLEITNWTYVHLIMGLTMGVQLLVQIAAVLVANRVQVREHRSLGGAAFLRPLLADVHDRARMATGKQIARLMGKNVRIRYEPVGAGYDLRIYRDGKECWPTPATEGT